MTVHFHAAGKKEQVPDIENSPLRFRSNLDEFDFHYRQRFKQELIDSKLIEVFVIQS